MKRESDDNPTRILPPYPLTQQGKEDAMGEIKMVCRDQILAREPNPAENRVEEQPYPVEDGEIRGFSLAPTYSLKQLREIERSIKNELTSRTPTRFKVSNGRLLTLADTRLDAGFDDFAEGHQ
jgi:hypothetical protein